MHKVINNLHTGTPAVVVSGTNGPALTISFLRSPGENVNGPARMLISRSVTDISRRSCGLYGARPLAGGFADATTVSGLAGQDLWLHTADGGITLMLADTAGRFIWNRNAQRTVSTVEYEDPGMAGRPLFVSEQPAGGSVRAREQFQYADGCPDHQSRNLAGALILHHDNARRSELLSASLTGQVLCSQECLLSPDADLPDWPLSEADLEDNVLTVSATYDATGAPLTQKNAAGVTTVTAYSQSDAVRETRLHYTDSTSDKDILTLSHIVRDADGAILSQRAGNGVTDTYEYDPRTRLLTRHTVRCEADGVLLSNLHYTYDPGGNILLLDEQSTAVQWHRNRVTDGKREYTYDTLYRLVSATGRETLCDTAPGPQTRLRSDGSGREWFPYREQYSYDDGDNLIKTVHSGNNQWTREMTVSVTSDRALLKPESGTADPDAGFGPGGLQKALSDGRTLSWHADGQLRQVSPVERTGGENDTERYHYSDGGNRVRKIRTTSVCGGCAIRTDVTTYAGGTETRQRYLSTDLQRNIVITEAGGVRLMEDRQKGEVHLRYAFTDHLGSSTGETDETGHVTSREEYYPYGGSAGADEEAEEIHDRTRRYSGKERDATGLLYYGWRYYQPETGRWLSADPGGMIDGMNLFRFCSNNPVSLYDKNGQDSIYFLYGTESSREHYLNRWRKDGRRYLRINDLNASLGITANMSGDLMRKIKQGIVVKDKNIHQLIGSFQRLNPGSSLEGNEARELLKGWSDFLKKNYESISVKNRLNKKDGGKYKDKTRVARELFLKNYYLKGLASSSGVREDILTPFDSAGKIKPEADEAIDMLAENFRKSNQAGFRLAKEIKKSERDIISQAMAHSTSIIFFRRTSKLGLDFAFSEGSGVSGVDFVTYLVKNFKIEGSVDANLYEKPWRDLDAVTQNDVYSPITSSERRYINKKKYPVRDIISP